MVTALASLLCTCKNNAAIPTAVIKSTNDSLSYAWGVQLTEALKQRTKDLNPDIVAAAVKEAFEEKSQFTPEECQTIVAEISQREQQKAMVENAKEGEAFLAENANKPGVMTTDSGLQYKIIEEGEGKHPTDTSTVEVHYTGKLLDGSVFDSSVERGETIEFPLNRVIAGWTEGVQLMKPGGKIELYIKPELAYGPTGSGSAIPPNATLIFEVELISIK